jgi:hypothetical protein
MQFDHTHYVACIRWKAAEKESLKWLGHEDKSRVTPLIELIPRSFSRKNGERISIRDAARTIAGEIDDY